MIRFNPYLYNKAVSILLWGKIVLDVSLLLVILEHKYKVTKVEISVEKNKQTGKSKLFSNGRIQYFQELLTMAQELAKTYNNLNFKNISTDIHFHYSKSCLFLGNSEYEKFKYFLLNYI